jgi:hypothetical protein
VGAAVIDDGAPTMAPTMARRHSWSTCGHGRAPAGPRPASGREGASAREGERRYWLELGISMMAVDEQGGRTINVSA